MNINRIVKEFEEDTDYSQFKEIYGVDPKSVKYRVSKLPFAKYLEFEQSMRSGNIEQAARIAGINETDNIQEISAGDNPYSNVKPGAVQSTQKQRASVPKHGADDTEPQQTEPEPTKQEPTSNTAKKKNTSDTPEVDKDKLEIGQVVVAYDKDGNELEGEVKKTSFGGVTLNVDGKDVTLNRNGGYSFKIPSNESTNDIDEELAKLQELAGVNSVEGYSGDDKDINELRKMAGLPETASAGATGAGAVASAPVSNTDILKRNSNLLSSSHDKQGTKIKKKGKNKTTRKKKSK